MIEQILTNSIFSYVKGGLSVCCSLRKSTMPHRDFKIFLMTTMRVVLLFCICTLMPMSGCVSNRTLASSNFEKITLEQLSTIQEQDKSKFYFQHWIYIGSDKDYHYLIQSVSDHPIGGPFEDRQYKLIKDDLELDEEYPLSFDEDKWHTHSKVYGINPNKR